MGSHIIQDLLDGVDSKITKMLHVLLVLLLNAGTAADEIGVALCFETDHVADLSSVHAALGTLLVVDFGDLRDDEARGFGVVHGRYNKINDFNKIGSLRKE